MAKNKIIIEMKGGDTFVVHGGQGRVNLGVMVGDMVSVVESVMDIEDAKDLVFALNKGLYDAGYRGEMVPPKRTADEDDRQQESRYLWNRRRNQRR